MPNIINANDYVVLDVETNGLSSINYDLLSISIYKPDDKKMYNRFLPLEMSNIVYTTHINGITEEMLKNQKPLTQDEFDQIVKEFELDKRTILTYGDIDEKFIKNYLQRKKITGFYQLSFYNFKHDIISSRYSGGNVTKDNLCRIYGIDNVQEVHSGLNDCILEWKLFKKMNGNKLLVINDVVYEYNNDYIIPVSYLSTFNNFKYCINNLPKIKCEIKELKKFRIDSTDIKRFSTNISGITIEHLINTLLDVEDKREESLLFLVKNKSKLKKIGELPPVYREVPIRLNENGTISAVNKEDKIMIEEINRVTEVLKERITPLIKFIKNEIFNNEMIMSQELVINKEDNVLANCDLSSKDKILEMKTYVPDLNNIKYQLYYEANGREVFFLETEWNPELKRGLIFTIYQVEIFKIENGKKHYNDKDKPFDIDEDVDLLFFDKNTETVELECKKCKYKWKTTLFKLEKNNRCPICNLEEIMKKFNG